MLQEHHKCSTRKYVIDIKAGVPVFLFHFLGFHEFLLTPDVLKTFIGFWNLLIYMWRRWWIFLTIHYMK